MMGSALFCLLTFLILWFVFMPMVERPDEDEGIMISFGDELDGLGFGDMLAGVQELSTTVPPQQAGHQELITQETERSIVIPKQQTNPRTTRPVTEQDLQRQEQQRREAAAAAEARQRQEAAARSENLVGSAFGSGGGTGSGTTSGDTRQGNPAGSGTSGGHGWSLSGRSLVGELATPDYPSNVEGRITVSIRVDAAGRVTSTTIGSPTNISDAQTRSAAVRAARNTRFSSGSGVSVGTITYNFRLR
jgi:TonB family protein